MDPLTILCAFLASFIASLTIAKIYQLLTIGRCRSQTCLVGKTALITGANSGIGYETAADFAKRGARVILACRDQERGNEARDRIIKETDNENIHVKIVDMASLASVRAFAKDVIATEERLDILVNNAGAAVLPRKNTEDGNLLIMQVNHLSHFLLTHLLADLLKKTEGSRVINVSSLLAKFADLDVNDLHKRQSHQILYNNTKACQILFTQELAKRLTGTKVTTYSLHPGAINTNIYDKLSSWRQELYNHFLTFFFKDSLDGAQTTIHTAVAKNLEKYSGEHFEECRPVAPYGTVRDPAQAKRLWEVSEGLVHLKPEEKLL